MCGGLPTSSPEWHQEARAAEGDPPTDSDGIKNPAKVIERELLRGLRAGEVMCEQDA
jgi:hypothetical protein